MGQRRQEKLSSLYQKLISEWIQRNLDVDKVVFAVTNAIISDDLRHLKVYFSVWPDTKANLVLKSLEKFTHELRTHLAEIVKAKFVPEVQFILDESEKNRLKIEGLLKKSK